MSLQGGGRSYDLPSPRGNVADKCGIVGTSYCTYSYSHRKRRQEECHKDITYIGKKRVDTTVGYKGIVEGEQRYGPLATSLDLFLSGRACTYSTVQYCVQCFRRQVASFALHPLTALLLLLLSLTLFRSFQLSRPPRLSAERNGRKAITLRTDPSSSSSSSFFAHRSFVRFLCTQPSQRGSPSLHCLFQKTLLTDPLYHVRMHVGSIFVIIFDQNITKEKECVLSEMVAEGDGGDNLLLLYGTYRKYRRE